MHVLEQGFDEKVGQDKAIEELDEDKGDTYHERSQPAAQCLPIMPADQKLPADRTEEDPKDHTKGRETNKPDEHTDERADDPVFCGTVDPRTDERQDVIKAQK